MDKKLRKAMKHNANIGVASITQLHMCVIKIVTFKFKGGHLCGKSDFHAIRNCS